MANAFFIQTNLDSFPFILVCVCVRVCVRVSVCVFVCMSVFIFQAFVYNAIRLYRHNEAFRLPFVFVQTIFPST